MSAITTGDLKAALLKAYPLPEYATFFEVGDGTGARQSRRADAVSMACWPSRGLRITGFELKASRSDWLREKKNPEKSIAVQQYCDRWMLFTAPGVVQPVELPPKWGLMELHGRKVVSVVEAPSLAPEPLSHTFVAALLRRAGEHSRDTLEAKTRQAIDEATALNEERIASEVARRSSKFEGIIQAAESFKAATGIDLTRGGKYAGEKIGKDFSIFQQLRDTFNFHALDHYEQRLREGADALRAARAALVEGGLVDAE